MASSSWAQLRRAWILLIVFCLTHVVVFVQSSSAATAISHSSAKLPTSLLSVIAELEDQGCDTFVTACLLTSQGVTLSQRSYLLKTLFSIQDDNEAGDASSTAVGTSSFGGLVVALSTSSLVELDSTMDACAGTIFYYASADDLSRGEGLFHTLGPTMERLLLEAEQRQSTDDNEASITADAAPSLIVLCDGSDASATSKTKDQLERAALSVLSNLISNRQKLSNLKDIFQSVQYVHVQQPETLEQAIASLQKREPSKVAQSISAPKATHSDGSSSNSLSSADLASARQLGPAARSALNAAITTVRNAISSPVTADEDADGNTNNFQLVTDFGKLCDAAIQRAVEEVDRQASRSSALLSSSVGKQIRANLRQELYAELGDLFDQQLVLLQQASFEQFRKDLSQLRVSAILAQDMEQVISKSLSAFAKAAQKLQPKGAAASSWSTWPAKLEFRRRIREYSRDRLLAARASGQYRPVPRKGINLGFHWLLPKPFGNDYRQEPWMVHATDNMVYVPKDKITDVTPEDVKSGGDWRRKIVPSPAGNDMIYMQ